MDRTLIATTPAAMEAAQTGMIDFADGKVREHQAEVGKLREELRIARENHWKLGPHQRRLKIEGRRLTFWLKVKAALRAGYYIVPNFAADAFAIRTAAKKPRHARTYYYVGGDDFIQPNPQLPAGEGRYVRPQASHYDMGEVKHGEGTRKLFTAADLEPVEFPVALMRPEVMDAAGKAMALKLFDDIAIADDEWRGADPMVLGRLHDPASTPSRPRPLLTFFIGWTLPLDRLR